MHWDTLLRWNQDPDVLYYAEADVTAYTLDQIKRIYSGISQAAALSPNSTASPSPRLGCRMMNLSALLRLSRLRLSPH